MISKRNLLITIIFVSIGTHFAFFGQPNKTVFDEVHFGKFISSYYTHQYYFDIHPPGGKLIIAGFAKLFNFSPEYSFASIGDTFPDQKYLALRFLPALAGMLLPIIIYFLALGLGLSTIASFGAGMLIALENALVTQSRLILLDPFLLLFGFTALLFYFKYKNSEPSKYNTKYLILMSVFGGLAMSIKWTGLTFIGIAGVIELASIIRNFSLKQIINLVLYFILIPLFIYFSIFVLHFSILTKSGNGDAFMSPAFQHTLQDSIYSSDNSIESINTFQKFIELNKVMYTSNKNLTATHPYSSKWYTWPFMARSIYYWNGGTMNPPQAPGTEAKIYLIGNPIIWFASTVAIFYLLITSLGRRFLKNKILLIILGGYLVNYLPFIGIGRVMFLYHYFSSLIFAILALAYLVDQQNNKRNITIGILIIAGLVFIYFTPLSYGLPLSSQAFNNRMWFEAWR